MTAVNSCTPSIPLERRARNWLNQRFGSAGSNESKLSGRGLSEKLRNGVPTYLAFRSDKMFSTLVE